MLRKEIIDMLFDLLRLFRWRLFMGTVAAWMGAALSTAFSWIIVLGRSPIVILILYSLLNFRDIDWFFRFFMLVLLSGAKVVLWDIDLIVYSSLILSLYIWFLFILVQLESRIFFGVVFKGGHLITSLIILRLLIEKRLILLVLLLLFNDLVVPIRLAVIVVRVIILVEVMALAKERLFWWLLRLAYIFFYVIWIFLWEFLTIVKLITLIILLYNAFCIFGLFLTDKDGSRVVLILFVLLLSAFFVIDNADGVLQALIDGLLYLI